MYVYAANACEVVVLIDGGLQTKFPYFTFFSLLVNNVTCPKKDNLVGLATLQDKALVWNLETALQKLKLTVISGRQVQIDTGVDPVTRPSNIHVDPMYIYKDLNRFYLVIVVFIYA